MKKILKILFAFLSPAWFAFSCAHAEEIELVPSDSVYINAESSNSGYTTPVIQEQRFTGSWPINSNSFLLGNNTFPDYSYYYNPSGSLTDTGVPYDRCYYARNLDYLSDFTITYNNIVIELDMSNLPSGYYRYEADIYVGIALDGLDFLSRANKNFNYIPNFIYPSSAVYISDSSSSMHCSVSYVGNDDFTITYYNGSAVNRLVHFYLTSTFQYDSQYGTDIVFDLQPFLNEFSPFSYDLSSTRTYWNGGYVAFAYNNRFSSSLFGNVDPPITPTPSPTPSPNQDIINNNNSNTTNIITTINDGFDALSAVFEGAIYGLTDLFFGSASDWIDFFSDVQDDMEEYLPVVTFFQSCKNILANFFNVESTDPTVLQYIAGWESDIYTLHIGALPLVLPEGTYNFFPEVNFDLNNPFMNEIRPYWLTFSNVLITLLFLRYLANYLFRWSQLLTGDTSVAFQLFHHAPDELENLGTDPYDLAGDYSYDSIDSANHDLYQDAEAHYGHGAARYLSKVFHSK